MITKKKSFDRYGQKICLSRMYLKKAYRLNSLQRLPGFPGKKLKKLSVEDFPEMEPEDSEFNGLTQHPRPTPDCPEKEPPVIYSFLAYYSQPPHRFKKCQQVGKVELVFSLF